MTLATLHYPIRASRTDFALLRQREFARLDETGTTYVDYTGAALYPVTLVRRHAQQLTAAVFGNPHSRNAPSLASSAVLNQARNLTLRFLDADPDEYVVCFTANASGAMRLLSETFPFRRGSRLLLTADNHNSVNGLRVVARRHGASVEYVPLGTQLRTKDPREWLVDVGKPSLFAFPAQSNFSGVQLPLTWIHDAQSAGYHVLLDAAAYVQANKLSLSTYPADFVALSYYKLFGYPSGIGALVARRTALPLLRRDYFAGGTVEFVSVQNRLVRIKVGEEAFEDGTPNFLAMPAVCGGLKWLLQLGMPNVQQHVCSLTTHFLKGLESLRGRTIVYGPTTSEDRGGTIAFNVLQDNEVVPFEVVEAAARARGIALRGGCFCNPGAAESAFSYPLDRAGGCYRMPDFTVRRFRNCLDGVVGALRASFGVANTRMDLDRLLQFLSERIEIREAG